MPSEAGGALAISVPFFVDRNCSEFTEPQRISFR
jgi:hypothetical protein